MSYDITTDVGKVRLRIGDTDDTNELLSNIEITALLTSEGSINLAAASACEAIAATYALNADSEKIGDYSFTQKAVDKYLKLAARLRETEASIPIFDWAEMDLTADAIAEVD